jgi:thioredoxin reductase (NADPH)
MFLVGMEKYDVIIIGLGPAGISAGIYSARYKMKTLMIGKLPGGLAGEAWEIHNFPSYEKISGVELITKMMNQVKKLGVDIKAEEVIDIKKKDGFEVTTNKNKYHSKKIILATGSERKKLDLERERELTGKGICYCVTCDAGFFKDKVVGVVGGGNSALTSAILLTKYAKKVYIIYRKNEFSKAEPSWVDEVKKNKKIEVLFETTVEKLLGKEKLEEIEISKKGKKEKLKVDGLFIEVGNVPGVELADRLGIKKEKDYIVVNRNQETNVKGVFAAGDVTNNALKQIIVSCGEGAVAAYSAYKELSKKE